MAMKSLLAQTKREKLGSIDGINLFFGALLGANLGTVGTMPLRDYILLIALLVALVASIRTASLSERRFYAHSMLAFCIALFALFLFLPGFEFESLSAADRDRLAATLVIWVVTATLVEFYPTRKEDGDQAGT